MDLIIPGSYKAVLVAWSVDAPCSGPQPSHGLRSIQELLSASGEPSASDARGMCPTSSGGVCVVILLLRLIKDSAGVTAIGPSGSLSTRVACTTPGPAAVFSLASGPLYPFA